MVLHCGPQYCVAVVSASASDRDCGVIVNHTKNRIISLQKLHHNTALTAFARIS